MKNLLLFLLLAPLLASGRPQWWMENDNRNELGVLHRISACPITMDELEDLISGVFARFPIEPVGASADFYLSVDIQCNPIKVDDRWISNINIDFAGSIKREKRSARIRFGREGYGVYGLGDKDDMFDIIEYKLDEAISDYYEINFAPDELSR